MPPLLPHPTTHHPLQLPATHLPQAYPPPTNPYPHHAPTFSPHPMPAKTAGRENGTLDGTGRRTGGLGWWADVWLLQPSPSPTSIPCCCHHSPLTFLPFLHCLWRHCVGSCWWFFSSVHHMTFHPITLCALVINWWLWLCTCQHLPILPPFALLCALALREDVTGFTTIKSACHATHCVCFLKCDTCYKTSYRPGAAHKT